MAADARRESLARRWAALLDEDRFDDLEVMMSDGCEYHSPSAVLTGVEAIADSYRKNAAWAHATFDEIEWDSEVSALADGRFQVEFEDRTLHRGQRHVYRCRQILEFADDDLICRITHVAIESEEKALAEFFRRVGVER